MKSILTVILFSFLSLTHSYAGIDNPVTAWKFQTKGPIRGGIVASGNSVYFGSADGHIYSIDKSSGKLNWKFKTNGSIVSTPALAEGRFIIVSSRDNTVYCLHAASGQLAWKYSMQAPVKFEYEWDLTMASPVIAGKHVLIGSGDAHLYSLSVDQGKLNWKFKTGGRIRATPLVANQVIYQPSHDGYLYALNLKGELQWKFETRGVRFDGKRFGFDRTSIYSSPQLADSLLVFGSRDGSEYCVNIHTQKTKWRHFYDGTWAMSKPLIYNGVVYLGWSTNFKFNAIDMATGKEKWQFTSKGVHYADPILVGNTLYVVSTDGNIYALDPATGLVQWQHKTGTSNYSTPWVDESGVYAGNDDGALYCIREQEKAMMAVYSPVPRNAMFRSAYEVDRRIAPFLVDKGFEHLDSAKLYRFLTTRIDDRKPSVVVFAYQDVPENIYGADPSKGLLRRYLESGGKVLWIGGLPKRYLVNEKGQFYKEDSSIGPLLVGLEPDYPLESGNYYNTSTQEGLNWGLPELHNAAYGIFAPQAAVTPLAINEVGQLSIWVKAFTNQVGTGFVSCRTWPLHQAIPDEHLHLLYRIAAYGLQ